VWVFAANGDQRITVCYRWPIYPMRYNPVRDLLTALWPLKVELCLLVLVIALVLHSIITPCAPAGRLRR
jgi:hypothetical protein